jgi:hypothetical protein
MAKKACKYLTNSNYHTESMKETGRQEDFTLCSPTATYVDKSKEVTPEHILDT